MFMLFSVTWVDSAAVTDSIWQESPCCRLCCYDEIFPLTNKANEEVEDMVVAGQGDSWMDPEAVNPPSIEIKDEFD